MNRLCGYILAWIGFWHDYFPKRSFSIILDPMAWYQIRRAQRKACWYLFNGTSMCFMGFAWMLVVFMHRRRKWNVPSIKADGKGNKDQSISSLANTTSLGQSSLRYLGSCIQFDSLGMACMGGILISSSWSRTILAGCSQCEWSCHFSLGNFYWPFSWLIQN